MTPPWLHWLSISSLTLAGICALVIAADELRRPQQMWVMNVVWPVTALFGSVAWLVGYFRVGTLATKAKFRAAEDRGDDPPSKAQTSFAAKVAKGASHCGSGCALGDLIAEWLVFLVPAVAVWFGYKTIFPDEIYAAWVVDFLFAFAIGVAFQYFTIVPMRGLSFGKGIWAAVKADTLSLTSWQIGMYGFMAVAHFYLFGHLLNTKLEVNTPEFWFMMQLAMLCGFATAYPVNWWLIRKGLKEKM